MKKRPFSAAVAALFLSTGNAVYAVGSATSESEDLFGAFLLTFLINLLITFVVYTLPIILYRFGIKREPLDGKKARLVVIVYAVAIFLVMPAVLSGSGRGATGGGLLFWSWINYKVLTKDYTAAELRDKQEKRNKSMGITSRRCPVCGAEMSVESTVCPRCGHDFEA